MKRPAWSRLMIAFLVATAIATVWGAIVQTQFNLARLARIGIDIPIATWLGTTARDVFSGFSPTYAGYIVAPSFLVAFAAAWMISRWRPSRTLLWFGLAGGAAILAGIPLVNELAPVALLIGATRDVLCTVLMAIGGLIAGLVFARMIAAPERLPHTGPLPAV